MGLRFLRAITRAILRHNAVGQPSHLGNVRYMVGVRMQGRPELHPVFLDTDLSDRRPA